MENRWKSVLEKGWKQPKLKKIRAIKCWQSKWLWRVWINKNKFILHKDVDIGTDTDFFCHAIIIINENCSIGAKCTFYTKNTENNTKGSILLNKNVLIGASCTILPGVVLYENEKIPANSVIYVKKNGERVIK